MAMLFGVLSAFTTKKDSAEDPMTGKTVTGFHLRADKVKLSDYNLWVITNDGTFDGLFESDHDSVSRPDFATEMVLAAKVETYATAYKVSIKKVERKGDDLNFYFSIQKDRKAKTGSNSVLMASCKKDASIKKVNFYHDNMMVKSIAIVNVY